MRHALLPAAAIVLTICILSLSVAENTGFGAKKKEPEIKLPKFRYPRLADIAAKVKDTEISGRKINVEVATYLQGAKRKFYERMKVTPKEKQYDLARKIILTIHKNVSTMPASILGRKITDVLVDEYARANKIESPPEIIAEIEKEIVTQAEKKQITVEKLKKELGLTEEKIKRLAAIQKMNRDACADHKLSKLFLENPEYFNGTTVTASHILIRVSPASKTEDQIMAMNRIKEILREIQEKTITFEDAAVKYSHCPSGKTKKGSLGQFSFGRMTPPFSEAAFNAKVGEIVGPIKTTFGVHLIRVDKKTKGKFPIDPKNQKTRKLALSILTNRLYMEIYDQATSSCIIQIFPAEKTE